MTDQLGKIVIAFELHDVETIKACFRQGINPNAVHDGQALVYSLINMYTRSKKFNACMQAFVDAGLQMEDKVLLAVLLDDAATLHQLLATNPGAAQKKYSFQCTYTPLLEASLLHICAEYNHLACADVLLGYGADVNAKAGLDENGFGGQTPIFHTVNQNSNHSIDMLHWLLANGADASVQLKGLVWGRGYEWETFMPAVNPASYAMMGMLPQVHRNETTIAGIVSLLVKHAYNIDYTPRNVPNKYLSH